MAKLSELVKTIRQFALKPSVSYEVFLNAFLFPFVIAGDIQNKNQEEFYLNKARTSKIVNQKEDVPIALRKALNIANIEEKTVEEMIQFVEEEIDPKRYHQFKIMLYSLAQEDTSIRLDIVSQKTVNEIATLLTKLLLRAIAEDNRTIPEITTIWKAGKAKIDVQSGDLFHFGFDNRCKRRNIVVIPVNTAFDTHVTRKLEGEAHPLVSENTIHGQWLTRMKESGESLERIYDRITKSLKETGFVTIDKSKSDNGRQSCYPIGATAIIETNNSVYFLTAIAEFDENNNARSSSDGIDKAILSLLDTYDRFGQGYDLFMPLVGTGLSRSGLSMQEAYDLLIHCLEKNHTKIHGHIHIVLRPEDRAEINLQSRV